MGIIVELPAGAGVAELADAQDLGSCGVTPVEVQVLSPAPIFWSLSTGTYLYRRDVRFAPLTLPSGLIEKFVDLLGFLGSRFAECSR